VPHEHVENADTPTASIPRTTEPPSLDPLENTIGAAGRIARLKVAVRPLMRAMSVARIEGQRTLDQPRPGNHRAGLDLRPAEISREPPVFGPMQRQLLEQCQLRLVMVAPAAEAQEPKDAERQRQRRRIARVFRGMGRTIASASAAAPPIVSTIASRSRRSRAETWSASPRARAAASLASPIRA